MSTYAIGDIHGCFRSLTQLLRNIDFHPSRDRLWLTGDVVNRGPESVKVMHLIMELGDAVQMVLGNHDLHAMAVACGVTALRPGDTLDAFLAAADCPRMLYWLRQQPLLLCAGQWGLVHAGLLPTWTTADAQRLAAAAAVHLRGSITRTRLFLAALQQPWDGVPVPTASADMQDIMVTKTLTYLRVCDTDGRPRLNCKDKPRDLPQGLVPWYAVRGRRSRHTTWVCGHWAAQGLHLGDNVRALDTGCVWGGKLTALRLEDETIYAVDAVDPAAHAPASHTNRRHGP